MSDFPVAPPPPDGGGRIPGSPGSRFIARLIDWAIAMVLFVPSIVLFLIGAAIGSGLGAILMFLAALLYIAEIVALFYVLVWVQGVTGQTPGKRHQGLMLLDSTSGQPVGGSGGVIRWLVEAITVFICYIGYLWIFVDSDKKTLYDKILDNEVVNVPATSIMPIFPDGKPF